MVQPVCFQIYRQSRTTYISSTYCPYICEHIYEERKASAHKKRNQFRFFSCPSLFLVSLPLSLPSLASFFYSFFLPIIATIGNCENTHTEHHTLPCIRSSSNQYSFERTRARALLNNIN